MGKATGEEEQMADNYDRYEGGRRHGLHDGPADRYGAGRRTGDVVGAEGLGGAARLGCRAGSQSHQPGDGPVQHVQQLGRGPAQEGR